MEAETQVEPYDYPQGYYHVRVSYAVNHKPAIMDLAKLADALPHGSGIDGDWYLKVRANGDIGITGEYHNMNDGGYYCGWSNFRFAIVKCRKTEFHPLKGPCEGQVQILRRVGDIYTTVVRGCGDNSEYLSETVDYALCELLTPMGRDTVSLETARAMGYRA